MFSSLEPIDRYQPLEVLGTGGFGSVYRARHMHTGEIVALKVLHTPAGALTERTLREARALAGFVHPNVVRVLDCGLGPGGQVFVAMELAAGAPLGHLMGPPMPPARAVNIAQQVLAGLAAVHARGIVHRDIKPSNIVVDAWSTNAHEPGRPTDRARLIDFGISRATDATLASSDHADRTRTGMALGTPGYMAPEQLGAAHEADGRADLYSVAVVLYQMLSGAMPHAARTYEDYVVSVRTSAPPSLRTVAPHLWPSLEAVIMHGLATEPSRRFASADEFSRALTHAMEDPVALSFAPTGRSLPQAAGAHASGPPTGHAAFGAPSHAAPSTWGPTPAPMVQSVRRSPSAASARLVASVALGIGLVLALGGGLVAVFFFGGPRSAAAPEAAVPAAPSSVAPPPTLQVSPASTVAAVPTAPAAGRAQGPRVSPVAAPVAPTPTPTPSAKEASSAPHGTAPCGHPGALPLAIASSPGVKVGAAKIIGQADLRWTEDVARAAAPRLGVCRPGCGQELVVVNLFLQPTGKISLAAPSADNAGDAAVARCVSERFRASAPAHDPNFPASATGAPHGIVAFPVLLEPK